MAPFGRSLLAASCIFLGATAGCGSSRHEPAVPPASGTANRGSPAPEVPSSASSERTSSPWLVAEQQDLRAVTVIVQVVPPPDIAEAFADLGARHKDLRPLMEAHNEGGFGSGFVVVARQPDGVKAYVVTNQHVVGLSTNVALGREGSSERVGGKVIYVDPIYDLAIVEPSAEARVDFHFDSGLGFSPQAPQDQDVVIASGFPGIQGDPSYQVTRGHVSNERVLLDIDGEKVAHIQHTAPIDRGSSGGPLLDERGLVLGINTLKIRWREGVGLAVPAPIIEGALERVLARRPTIDHQLAAKEACDALLREASGAGSWGHAERMMGAGLVAKEGARSLWLLPDGDTDWLAEFVEDPARVMAQAMGYRLRRELNIMQAMSCEPRSTPTEPVQTFAITSGSVQKSFVFGVEQGSLKLLDYTFSSGTGRSFLDPKQASTKKWTPSL